VYDELGWTLTIWLHCASSLLVGVPASANDEPVSTGEVTALSPDEQVHPDVSPVEKPPLVSRLVCAEALGAVSPASVSAASTIAQNSPRRA
jgi:hypothetical protein